MGLFWICSFHNWKKKNVFHRRGPKTLNLLSNFSCILDTNAVLFVFSVFLKRKQENVFVIFESGIFQPPEENTICLFHASSRPSHTWYLQLFSFDIFILCSIMVVRPLKCWNENNWICPNPSFYQISSMAWDRVLGGSTI